MADTIVVRIDRNVDDKSKEMAAKLDMPKKKFIEEAAMFFARNNISPVGFSPSADFDVSQLVKKSTDRIISFFRYQEKEMIAPLALQVLRTQIAIQALMNLLIDLNVPAKDQADVAKRLEEYITSTVEKLQNNAHESDQPATGR